LGIGSLGIGSWQVEHTKPAIQSGQQKWAGFAQRIYSWCSSWLRTQRIDPGNFRESPEETVLDVAVSATVWLRNCLIELSGCETDGCMKRMVDELLTRWEGLRKTTMSRMAELPCEKAIDSLTLCFDRGLGRVSEVLDGWARFESRVRMNLCIGWPTEHDSYRLNLEPQHCRWIVALEASSNDLPTPNDAREAEFMGFDSPCKLGSALGVVSDLVLDFHRSDRCRPTFGGTRSFW
jgi:hypothetical protein